MGPEVGHVGEKSDHHLCAFDALSTRVTANSSRLWETQGFATTTVKTAPGLGNDMNRVTQEAAGVREHSGREAGCDRRAT